MRSNRIKRLLKEGKPAVGTWLTLGNVLAARLLARGGWDWLTVDTEHNAIGIETAAACFDAVYSVPGIDAVFVGPNDLARSMHSADGKPPSPEAFNQALADILAGCKRNKVAAGIHTFGAEEARLRIADGWQFIAVGSELK